MDNQSRQEIASWTAGSTLIGTGLSDGDLVARIKSLVRIENKALALLLAHLIELDRRKLFAGLGFASLFAYCTRELGYSEDAACRRIIAARTAAKFPVILDLLQTGRAHLAAVVALSPHLTEANHAALLTQARGRTRREIESLAAGLEPAAEEPADRIRCGGAGRVAFSFIGDQKLLAKVERARQLLRHKHPEGRLESIIDDALDLLLNARDPSLWKSRKRPEAAAAGGRRNRYIPKSVKQEVWKRDGGLCAFVSQDGRRCEERAWLQFDHIIPWALGGSSTDPGNIRLLCCTHNQHLARETFGESAAQPKRKYPRQRG